MPKKSPLPKPPKTKTFSGKRAGALTKTTKDLVKAFVEDQPATVTEEQIRALAKLTRHTPATMRKCVEDTRADLAGRLERYANIHMGATELALATGNVEAAQKGAQWALENVSVGGERVVNKAPTGSGPAAPATSNNVFVGVQLGGVDSTRFNTVVTEPIIEADAEE